MHTAWKEFQAYDRDLRGVEAGGNGGSCGNSTCTAPCCGDVKRQHSGAAQQGAEAAQDTEAALAKNGAGPITQSDYMVKEDEYDDMPPLEPIDAPFQPCATQQQRQQQQSVNWRSAWQQGQVATSLSAEPVSAGACDAQRPQQQRRCPLIEEVADDESSPDLNSEWAEALSQPPPPSPGKVAATTTQELATLTLHAKHPASTMNTAGRPTAVTPTASQTAAHSPHAAAAMHSLHPAAAMGTSGRDRDYSGAAGNAAGTAVADVGDMSTCPEAQKAVGRDHEDEAKVRSPSQSTHAFPF